MSFANMTRAISDIRIKRVYDLPEASDGVRVLVDRLWPRGLRKEDAALTLWLKDIAPSAELRKWFGHDPGRWLEFKRRYSEELSRNEPAISCLENLLKQRRVTLLYAAHDTEHNNALVLASFLQDHLKSNDGCHTP